MENLHIRHAWATDQRAVVACVSAAYARYTARMHREAAPVHANYEALIAQGVVYVLVAEYEVRGVLVMIPENGSMLVENVAIDPRFQGQGLGRRLMAYVEQQARSKQLHEIRLYTNEVMSENLRFYHYLGFEEEDRRVEDGYHRVFLHKEL